jgi:peroxiredoxin Q/BCP
MSKRRGDALQPGMTAPEFELEDAGGRVHRLTDYRGRWVVLYFYPRDNTPGCTTEACDFQDALAGLHRAGADVLGVSPDSPESHGRFRDKYGLNFTLLADPEKTVAKSYGVWQKKSLYGKMFFGIVRSTFLIDPGGKLHTVMRNVRAKGHVAKVVELLRQARAEATA